MTTRQKRSRDLEKRMKPAPVPASFLPPPDPETTTRTQRELVDETWPEGPPPPPPWWRAKAKKER